MTAVGVDADELRPAGLPDRICHYIDGRLVEGRDQRWLPLADPVTNAAYAEVAAGSGADVDAAVAAAGAAFVASGWADLPARRRAAVLMAIGDAIERRDETIARYESFDTGLPITQARGQAKRAAENFRFFADLLVGRHEEAFRTTTSQLGYVLRRPIGIAGLITPWNTPFMLETWKLAPALAAGCCVVLKPAEWTPLSASLLPVIMEEAGVPRGVFNMVQGIGEVAGAALVEHPRVPALSFTGETTTGRVIMASAATHLKRLSMELGGKSPVLVFADADLEGAVDGALFGVFSLNGERCTAGSRILVERGAYEEFTERFAERARQVRVGLPHDPATEVGALVHPAHLERVKGYVESGIAEGARLVAGGGRPAHLGQGNFLEATVFADVSATMRIFQEEIFGPVACLSPFDDEDEALRLANATPYGLAGYVWTDDLRRAHRVAAGIDAGMMWVNSHNIRDLRTPFGGIKASGVGHEGGERSLDLYTEERMVHVALERAEVPRFGRGGAGGACP